MSWLHRLLRRDRLEQELDAELRFHVDRLIAEYTADGLSEREARRRALREFGALEMVKDECRQARGTEWLVAILTDARIGLRLFLKEPGFSAVAVAALALGLGINTIFFSIVDTFCLSGLPFPNAAELIDVSIRDDSGRSRPLSPFQIRAISDGPAIDRVGVYTTRSAAVRTPHSVAARRTVAYVSDDVLGLIGETPAHGRSFRPEEHRSHAERVALVSARESAELFGGEAAAIGRNVVIDGVTTVVVGVMPAASRFPDNADLWQPLSTLGLADDAPALTAFARVRSAVPSLADAQSQLETALRRTAALPSDRQRVVIVPLNDTYRGRVTDPVWVAFITAGALVVLIACSNVGNLLLARGVRRTGEIATRVSLGATRARIFGQLLTETLVLVAFACGAAIVVAWAGLHALRAAIPQAALPYWSQLGLDWRATAALFGVGCLTVVLSGMAPAAQLLSVTSVPFNMRTVSHGKSIGRWSSAFLTIQLALSVVLLCAVGITVQVYRALAASGMQARVAEVLSAEISLSGQRYATPQKREQFLKELRDGLTTSGQITDVSFAPALPGTRGEPRMVIAGSISTAAFVGSVAIDAAYFRVLGVPLLSGPGLTDEDRDISGSAVLVNERFARLFFGDVSVVGRQIRFASANGKGDSTDSRVIAGVVPALGGRAALNPPPIVYIPRPVGAPTVTLLARGVVPPEGLASTVSDIVSRLDPDVALSDVLPLTEATWQARWNGRVSQALITAIASVGLCLAMVGVSALTAHRIATRARELSIRVALGARPSQLIRGVLRPVMVQLAGGLVVGGLLAKGWQRAFSSPIAATDNLALVAGLVTVATLLFSAWPARRAAHADPIDALRSDG